MLQILYASATFELNSTGYATYGKIPLLAITQKFAPSDIIVAKKGACRSLPKDYYAKVTAALHQPCT